ncbi:MAG: SRPBCC family protein [Bacteroidota bacterium]
MIVLLTLNASSQDRQATDRHFWYTLETSASPDKIWRVWTDVARWKDWDTGLKDAEMEGDFQLGQKGVIISLEGRKSTFEVVAYAEGSSYTYKTRLPLGSLYVKRYLTSENGKTLFTHEVWFKGLTKGIFAKAFGGKFRKMLPQVLENVKQLAESS